MKRFLPLFLIIVLPFSSCSKSLTKSVKHIQLEKQRQVKVLISAPDESRWQHEAENIVRIAQGFSIDFTTDLIPSTEDGHMLQRDSIVKHVHAGYRYIILIAFDSAHASSIVAEAKRFNDQIKFIAYDRPVANADIDLFITSDSLNIGMLQAQYLYSKVGAGRYLLLSGDPGDENAKGFRQGALNYFRPLIASRRVTIVGDRAIAGWTAENAKRIVLDYIRSGVGFDAILCPSDGPALGVIDALSTVGLAGKIPITGLDGLKSALEDIDAGYQIMTIYKDSHLYAMSAVNAILLYEQKLVPFYDSLVFNGLKDVPTHNIDVTIIDKNNLSRYKK